MKFSTKDFFSKCDQIRRLLWVWSHLLKKSLVENFIFCEVESSMTVRFPATARKYLKSFRFKSLLTTKVTDHPAGIYLLVQGQQRKHRNNRWNMIRVNSKGTKSWQTVLVTSQKMKFSTKDFFSKCDQIRRNLRIWSHLLKKSLVENFIFWVVCAILNFTLLREFNYLYSMVMFLDNP